ncbi:MAG: hypothetical protein P1S46_10240 [bacterium]|nr:hypothetical protein [bacterium]MDT8396684.1 hypothetical protein [bacterium]
MYELLSDVAIVPVKADFLKRVYTGMNKVRISVGEHISEPSEVYIVTGDMGKGYETYIVFFMIEPAFHIVYGCDKNPYDPAGAEEAIDEAIDFVEAMGSILEEVPWETMSSEQRASWAGKEALYRETGTIEPELLEVDDEIASTELLEVIEEENPEGGLVDQAPETDNGATEVDDDQEPEVEDKPPRDNVLVADGDFDELLKQAFLKPEDARKTGKRKGMVAAIEEVAEEPVEPAWEEAMEKVEPDGVGATEEEIGTGGVEVEEEELPPPEENIETEAVEVSPVLPAAFAPGGGEAAAGLPAARPDDAKVTGDAAFPDDRKIQLSVVRFLSRF